MSLFDIKEFRTILLAEFQQLLAVLSSTIDSDIDFYNNPTCDDDIHNCCRCLLYLHWHR